MFRKSLQRFILTATTLALLIQPVFSTELDRSETGPLPGDEAPTIHAAQWLRGDPVEHYLPGHVYIVDLWATWCGPCLTAMPLLRDFQDRYPEDLTVIAMNVWELQPKRVPDLVKARADSIPSTVAVDSIPPGKEFNEGLTAVAFLGTSDAVSIPRTYLIDKKGRIAWIGTPDQLEDPLTQVLAGSWDLEAYAANYVRKMKVELKYRELSKPVETAVAQRRWQDALDASEAVVSADSSFAPKIAHSGFIFTAMSILNEDAPSTEEFQLADHALKRALELDPAMDWRTFLMSAKVAKALGNLEEASDYLAKAKRYAPPDSKSKLPSTVEELTRK
jgi:thiol-disulfide isomerase/thioredoxin